MSESSSSHARHGQGVTRLREILRRLRDPEQGCPWDKAQNFSTIAPYTLEESYEVVDAIEKRDMAQLCDELGDLLFQIVFYTQMAEEAGHFSFDDITTAINEKMIRRHPHVFGEETVHSIEAQSEAWEQLKAKERSKEDHGPLDGIAQALPALIRAEKLQKRAARMGFDWGDVQGPLGKLEEESQELHAAIHDQDQENIEEELGDLLFTCVNVSRHLHIDAESALRRANEKFYRRFQSIYKHCNANEKRISDYTPKELDALWQQAKGKENFE